MLNMEYRIKWIIFTPHKGTARMFHKRETETIPVVVKICTDPTLI